MREFSVPATTEVGPDEALTDYLAANVAEHGGETGFRVRRNGQWQDVTWKEFGDQVAGVAKGLIAAGVAPGDRVALQAKTRYEWTVLDFAIWTAGAVVVPIYETSSADQVAWILSDSGATAVIVERDEHADGRGVGARPGARPAVGLRHRRRRHRRAHPGRQGRPRQRARRPGAPR